MNSNSFRGSPVPNAAPASMARTWILPALLGLLISAGLYVSGCKKDEAPPPLPSATASEEAPAPALTLAPEEDAGMDADADAPTGPKGPYKPAQSLKNCCSALRQNAASAPPPTNGYMLAAAAVCDGLAASGADRGSAVAQIRAALKGANLPSACY